MNDDKSITYKELALTLIIITSSMSLNSWNGGNEESREGSESGTKNMKMKKKYWKRKKVGFKGTEGIGRCQRGFHTNCSHLWVLMPCSYDPLNPKPKKRN